MIYVIAVLLQNSILIFSFAVYCYLKIRTLQIILRYGISVSQIRNEIFTGKRLLRNNELYFWKLSYDFLQLTVLLQLEESHSSFVYSL